MMLGDSRASYFKYLYGFTWCFSLFYFVMAIANYSPWIDQDISKARNELEGNTEEWANIARNFYNLIESEAEHNARHVLALIGVTAFPAFAPALFVLVKSVMGYNDRFNSWFAEKVRKNEYVKLFFPQAEESTSLVDDASEQNVLASQRALQKRSLAIVALPCGFLITYTMLSGFAVASLEGISVDHIKEVTSEVPPCDSGVFVESTVCGSSPYPFPFNNTICEPMADAFCDQPASIKPVLELSIVFTAAGAFLSLIAIGYFAAKVYQGWQASSQNEVGEDDGYGAVEWGLSSSPRRPK